MTCAQDAVVQPVEGGKGFDSSGSTYRLVPPAATQTTFRIRTPYRRPSLPKEQVKRAGQVD